MRQLLFVKGADSLSRNRKRRNKRLVDLGLRPSDLIGRDLEGQLGGFRRYAVDLFVVAPDSGVAVLANVAQDAIDDLGRAELGAEDAADQILNRGRELTIIERRSVEYGRPRLLGALDYAHWR